MYLSDTSLFDDLGSDSDLRNCIVNKRVTGVKRSSAGFQDKKRDRETTEIDSIPMHKKKYQKGVLYLFIPCVHALMLFQGSF